NSPDVIARNRRFVSINGAISVDLYGQVAADTRGRTQFSGIGGHEDFVTGGALELEDRSVVCMPSTAKGGGAGGLPQPPRRAGAPGGPDGHHAAAPSRRRGDGVGSRRGARPHRARASRRVGRRRAPRLPRPSPRRSRPAPRPLNERFWRHFLSTADKK